MVISFITSSSIILRKKVEEILFLPHSLTSIGSNDENTPHSCPYGVLVTEIQWRLIPCGNCIFATYPVLWMNEEPTDNIWCNRKKIKTWREWTINKKKKYTLKEEEKTAPLRTYSGKMEKNPHSKRVQRNSSNQCTIMKNLKVNIKSR